MKNNKKIVGKKEVNFWRLATKEKMDILRKFGHQGKNGYFNKIWALGPWWLSQIQNFEEINPKY